METGQFGPLGLTAQLNVTGESRLGVGPAQTPSPKEMVSHVLGTKTNGVCAIATDVKAS